VCVFVCVCLCVCVCVCVCMKCSISNRVPEFLIGVLINICILVVIWVKEKHVSLTLLKYLNSFFLMLMH
jgi:hypothetical protein